MAMLRPSSINQLVRQFGITRLLASISGLVATYPFDDPPGVLARVVNPAMGVGRNVVLNPTPTSAASWNLGAGWAFGANSFDHTPGNTASINQNIPITPGKTYRITFETFNQTAGTIAINLGGTTGTARSANGIYVQDLACGTVGNISFAPSTLYDGSIRNISVQQVSEPASASFSGANLLANRDGDMELQGRFYWSNSDATLTKVNAFPPLTGQMLRIARISANNPFAFQLILTVGKTYYGNSMARGDGNAVPAIYLGSSGSAKIGTSSSLLQKLELLRVATATNLYLQTQTITGTQFTEWDNVTVREISPLSGHNGNGAVANMPVQGAPAGAVFGDAYSFDGNDFVNLYSTDLNSYFNPDEGTLFAFCKVSAAVWVDGIQRRIITIRSDANNQIFLRKSTGNNQVDTVVTLGGVIETAIKTTFSPSTLFMLVVTWSKAADQVIFYVNGVLEGGIQTVLGQWAGNLSTTECVVGASSTAGATGWIGLIVAPTLYNRALTAAEILSIARAGGVA